MMTDTMPKSIFSPRPDDRPPLSNQERIEDEVLHLRKGTHQWRFASVVRGVMITALTVIALLFFAEPFIYAYKKDQAIRSYLYLQKYGSPEMVQALETSGMLTDRDLRTLEERTAAGNNTNTFRNYFASPAQAQATAEDVLAYNAMLMAVSEGNLTDAGPFQRVRYHLFTRWGLKPPVEWSMLNPDPRSYGSAPPSQDAFQDKPSIYKTKKSEAWRLR